MDSTEALRKTFTLYRGDLTKLASKLQRHPATLLRLITGERPSRALAQAVKDETGYWPHEIEVSPKNRPDSPEAKAA